MQEITLRLCVFVQRLLKELMRRICLKFLHLHKQRTPLKPPILYSHKRWRSYFLAELMNQTGFRLAHIFILGAMLDPIAFKYAYLIHHDLFYESNDG